jgi:cyclohexa-1,5-dienecarbonyl-CoA hydratase
MELSTSMDKTRLSADTRRVVVELSPPVAHIRLVHPPLNVLDFQIMDELSESLGSIEQRSEIAALIFSGDERAFSAGVDIAIHTPDQVPAMLQKFHRLIGTIAKLSKITIAAVRGVCLGGGAELAMICDLVYTTKTAQWGFPEITLGCYPPVACAALSALIGQKRAADLIFTGRTIGGEEAARWGLANEAHSEDELQGAIQRTVDHLLKLSPAALAAAKTACYAWDSIHLDKGLLRAEKIYLEQLMPTEDAQEGIHAWLEKRNPRWKGR